VAEGGLVADDENRRCGIGPAAGSDEIRDASFGTETAHGLEGQPERLGGLLAAHGRADQNAHFPGLMFLDPRGHRGGLFFAARGQLALQIDRAVFGLGMTPEQ